MITDQFASRYWAKVTKAGPDDCWLWTGAKTPFGYGKIKSPDGFRYAHHLALEIAGQPRPSGSITLHSCDVPSCCNPNHLAWGDQKTNVRQAIARGRASHIGRVAGERNGNAKLCAEQVKEIRRSEESAKEVAARHGVSPQLVSAIRNLKAWRHI